ncbi:Ni-sirohydrochlorin a,c-diamide reductive cyclase catalytic subunit [Methanosarcinaceae archaeon]|nr:Ni-sirohydrochlorin a,c-diamide reductive cyclase catalytic subunit [Methanosarcinaceae archaeon]
MSERMIIHPRPSSIVASLYTLRDLKIDVAILHGPPGCSFKHARLLEEDGIHVLTTAMDENDFVFGAHDKLTATLKKAIELFSPKSMAIVGTCTSMIIGEELSDAAKEIDTDIPILCVEIHAGQANNTRGVMAVLEPAVRAGLVTPEELKRQEILLKAATDVELKTGAASRDYLGPSRGDLKYKVAAHILELIRNDKRGLLILNAKKETAYMFADELVAVYETAKALGKEKNLALFANLDENCGLPRVREHALNILKVFREKNIPIAEIIGGLDEYAVTGDKVAELTSGKYSGYDYAFIAGVPHAIPTDAFGSMEIISVTNGPRQVLPMKEMGHRFVMVEIDLHPKTLGIDTIVPSEFGDTLRSMLADETGK